MHSNKQPPARITRSPFNRLSKTILTLSSLLEKSKMNSGLQLMDKSISDMGELFTKLKTPFPMLENAFLQKMPTGWNAKGQDA